MLKIFMGLSAVLFALYLNLPMRPIDAQELNREYEHFARSWKGAPAVHLFEVRLSTDVGARALWRRLKAGTISFDKAAQTSTAPSRVRGGDIGHLTAMQLNSRYGEEIRRQLFASQANELHPPMKWEGAWYIFYVGERSVAAVPPLAEVEADLKRTINSRRELKRFLSLVPIF